MNSKHLTSLGLLILLAALALPTAAEEGSIAKSEDLVFTAADFQNGLRHDATIETEGLTLRDSRDTGTYLSPVIEAPIAFNAIVPQWLATIPESTSLNIQLRTGTAAGWWSEWYSIAENHDWMLPDDPDIVGQMIAVPAVDVTHDQVQFSVSITRYEGAEAPILEEFRLTFIDSSKGPTAEEMLTQQEALDRQGPQAVGGGYPKPTVISRSVWCTDPACNYNNGLEYRSVSHLIVHHTVSSNSSSNWAAVVRAIWQYHTFTRGWGDIGYNYLVDMNGVLYEGHNGGDDVIGTHAGDANTGSMALAFLGTFTAVDYPNLPGIAPPAAMKNSAVELFSWKADQKGIDVYGASRLPNMSWGLPHLMGHRDVYGGTNTECPGDQAHAIIPELRDRVAQKIGKVPNHVNVSELSSAFKMSNQGNWWEARGECGYNGHAYYTWSTTDPGSSTNWGEWQPNLPLSDHYEILVYAPYCDTDRGETYGAKYTITHANGTTTKVVSHQANIGLWISLGTYYFNAGTGGKVRLTDLTTTDSGRGIWFDDVRFRPSKALPEPRAVLAAPAPASWVSNRKVDFSWTLSNPSSIVSSQIQIATDSQFKSLIVNQPLDPNTTSWNYQFGQDYNNLYWRIILKSVQGNTIYSGANRFGIDTVAPTSSVNFIARLESGKYVVGWTGSDSGSGVATYDIDIRVVGGSWSLWLDNTNGDSALFTKPDPTKEYEFRSRATDRVGLVETPHSLSDIGTQDAVQLYRAIMFPQIRR